MRYLTPQRDRPRVWQHKQLREAAKPVPGALGAHFPPVHTPLHTQTAIPPRSPLKLPTYAFYSRQ